MPRLSATEQKPKFPHHISDGGGLGLLSCYRCPAPGTCYSGSVTGYDSCACSTTCSIGVYDNAHLRRLSTMHRQGKLPVEIRIRGRLVDGDKRLLGNFPVCLLMPFGHLLKTATDAKGEFKLTVDFANPSGKKGRRASANLGVLISGRDKKMGFTIALGLAA